MNKSDRFDNHTNVLFNTVQKILEEDESIREDLMSNRDLSSIEAKFSADSCHNYNSFGLAEYEMQNYSFPKSRIETQRYSAESSISTLTEGTKDLESSNPIHEIVEAILNGITDDQTNISISFDSKSLGLIHIEISCINPRKISEIKFLSSISKALDLLAENEDHLVKSMKQILGYDDISFEFTSELSGDSDNCIFYMEC